MSEDCYTNDSIEIDSIYDDSMMDYNDPAFICPLCKTQWGDKYELLVCPCLDQYYD